MTCSPILGDDPPAGDDGTQPTPERPATASSPAPGAGLTIGELAAEFDVTTRAIRFYEKSGLITPQRRRGNRRYSERDHVRLMLILRGRNLGFTLKQIGEYLSLYDSGDGKQAQNTHLLDQIDAHMRALHEKQANIEAALVELKAMRDQCIEEMKGSGGRGE